MKLSKIMNEALLSESDILRHSPELKTALTQEIPMLMKKINEECRSDNYTTLVRQLELLSQTALKARHALEHTLKTKGAQIHNKERSGTKEPMGLSSPNVFSIRDEEI